MLDHMKSNIVLERFAGDTHSFYRRIKYETWLKNGYTTTAHDIKWEGGSRRDLRQWLDVIDGVSEELGVEPQFYSLEDDAPIVAEFYIKTPLTKEQREEAEAWLLDNPPYTTSVKIKWRKPIPFNTGDTNNDDL